MKNSYKIALVIPFLFLVAGCADTAKTTTSAPTTEKIAVSTPKAELAKIFAGTTAKLYRSPNCGCCTGHAKAMEAAGISVEVISDDTMLNNKKTEYQIANNMQSCHTIEMVGYFIEGHVPLEAMAKLISEKPAIDGIALPGMPIGTPGMPGKKTESYKVRQIVDGENSEFITL